MKKNILIAEDEPHVARVLKMILEKSGYCVNSVSNGALALDMIRQQEPDVLITDIQMPVMNGEQLCRHLEEEIPEREFLIFVLTSRTEIEHRYWTKEIPRVMFLEKPVSTRRLVDMLDKYFNVVS